MTTVIARLPSVFLVLAYLALGSRPLAAAILGVSFLLPPFVNKAPLRMDTVAAAFALVFAGTWAFAVEPGPNLLGGDPMKPLYETISLGAIAALAVRARFAEVDGGRATSVLIAMLGVMALGRAQPKSLYPFVVAGFAVLAALALRWLDPVRLAKLRGRALGLATLASMLAVGLTASIAWALPPMHDRVQSLAIRMLGGSDDTRQAGFSDAISLGDISKILGSDALALRVYGPHVDHLRGVVYTRYGGGRWFAPLGNKASPIEASTNVDAATVIVEHTGAPTDRWFVPAGASALAVDGVLRRDSTGVFTPDGSERADRIGFSPGTVFDVASPDEDDLAIPEELRAQLVATASVWTAAVASDEKRANEIEARLAEFTYALEIPPRPAGTDPVLAFLENRTGHCELFASAEVLLLRSLGVPARVVGGYRVVERNELAGHWTVRNRNAHAWVEVWLGDRWVTRDPTPPGALAAHMPSEPSGWEAFEDAVMAKVETLGRWLRDRILWVAPLLVIASLLFLFRRELADWLRPKPPPPAVEGPLVYRDPIAAYVAFEADLARRGHSRRSNETLEAFAERLEREAALSDAASVVRAHAASRYGRGPAPNYSV